MVLFGKIVLLLGLVASTAAQCQDYWKGTAPFCKPDDSCNAGLHYYGITDVRGDGARCFTGKKKLCQCITSGGTPACVPTLPPKTYTILHGWVTICHNGCNIYICGVKSIRFWKRDQVGVQRRGLHPRRLLPCEESPDQVGCQPVEPVEPSLPPNEISSKPLTPDDVLNAFRQTESGVLAEHLAALGEDTTGKSQEVLVQDAYAQFQSSMATLDIGQVDPKASFDTFEQGQSAWAYAPDSVSPVVEA